MVDKIEDLLKDLFDERRDLVKITTAHSNDTLDKIVRVQIAIQAVQAVIDEGNEVDSDTSEIRIWGGNEE